VVVLKFNPQASLIRLRVVLVSEFKKAAVMVFDPGASITLVTPQIAEALGSEFIPSASPMSIFTAGGTARAHRLQLKSLSLYGETLAPVDALCSPLPTGLGADGLLGLNVLRHLKIGLDFETGTLTFDRIQSVSPS
jgi:predicted aspartyl protease